MQKRTVLLQVLDPELIPKYKTDAAAGADLRSASSVPISILPGQSALIPTGIRVAIPEGFEMQIRPRSGLALEHQITVLNSPGTIDADYRGEIGVILFNHGSKPFLIEYGMRIAQIILSPVYQADFCIEKELSQTVRGESGFGHTGIH